MTVRSDRFRSLRRKNKALAVRLPIESELAKNVKVMSRKLRIATRKSPLALWQANFVRQSLEKIHKDLKVELVPMSTQGDKILDSPLAKIGGKGLFVKELEMALLQDTADVAVHSMKDVPMEFPEGL